MINIVLSTMFYPVAIGKYFMFALQRRKDVNLFTVGPWTGQWIPWKGGMHLPLKYSDPPDMPIPRSLIGNISVNPAVAEHLLPFKPDLWINVDAGFAFTRPNCPYAIVATDPHVLNYDKQRRNCDKFYNMQKFYSQEGDIYLPYAADLVWHKHEDLEKEYDACLIGLQYENRTMLVNALRALGRNVFYDTGIVYDEYREIYNKSKIALSWSSKDDLIARVFEGMFMAIPVVCNNVPDLPLNFVKYEHYIGFDSIAGAIAAVNVILDDYEYYMQMAWRACEEVRDYHLYDHRIEQILKDFELI